ncbi:MAG: hypothetical protein L6Q73_12855 [Aquabacterium sp.]|jgi:hypothetical protein|nr:hypothetical protein [Aquabacterium sp.]
MTSATNAAMASDPAGGRVRRTQAGMNLAESLLVLGVAALVTAGSYGAYNFAVSDVTVESQARAIVTLIAQIRRVNGQHDYTGVTPAGVQAIVPPGWQWDGTDVRDSYRNPVGISGSAVSFALLVDQMSSRDCQKLLPMVAGMAYRIHVGPAAAAAGGAVSGGDVFKAADGSLTGSAIANGCTPAGRKIAVEVR